MIETIISIIIFFGMIILSYIAGRQDMKLEYKDKENLKKLDSLFKDVWDTRQEDEV